MAAASAEGCHRQRDQGEEGAAAIARDIRRQRKQRTQPWAALSRLGLRLRGRGGKRAHALRRPAGGVLKPFHCAHAI